MAKRRPVSNPLALAVLTFLISKPMYPYEMASVLRSTGKDLTIKINWGSLYTVMQNLEKHGLVKEASTSRQGGRPERTAYAITDAGRAELRDWLGELLAEPQQEYPLFPAALSLVGALAPDEAIGALRRRLVAIETELAANRAELRTLSKQLPRLFLIENEYLVAMRGAEARWIRALLKDIADGAMPEIEQWRDFHDSGQFPEDLTTLLKEGSAED